MIILILMKSMLQKKSLEALLVRWGYILFFLGY